LLAQIRQAAQQIDDLREGTGGRIAVGTLPAGASVLLPTAIGRLHKGRHKIVFSVTEGINETLVPALRRGQLDLVLGRLPDNGDAPDLVQEPLFRDTAFVVVRPGHPLTSRANLALADLVQFEWILPPVETTLRRRIEQAFHEANLEGPQPTVETVSLLLIRGLLQATDYLCVWPWQVAYGEAAVGRAAILPIGLPPTEGPIGMTLWREATPSPAVQVFKNMLRAVARELELSPLLELRSIRTKQV
jgi:DNA-binding transcriptional LysR family regulator